MTIRSKPATREYRDGWNRVFGKPPPPNADELRRLRDYMHAHRDEPTPVPAIPLDVAMTIPAMRREIGRRLRKRQRKGAKR